MAKLGLFFTRGVSLKTWEKVGNLDREIKPYQKLLSYFDEIYFFTYDKKIHKPSLYNIVVLGASVFRKELKNIDVYKTNQMNGSWKAVIAKKLYSKKLVVRQGYQWSIFARNKKVAYWKQLLISLIERFAYKNADAIMVSSKADIDYIIEKYKTDSNKIYYMPNYVDTELFKPMNIPNQDKRGRICTVAKLEKQKNLENLIEAVRPLDIELIIIGSGSLKDRLKSLAPSNVKIIENIPNNKLPEEINKSQLFILPSHFEGCPKALLEAMSCGVPVIGTKVPGIDEIIKHKENGYLCDISIESIRMAIKEVLSDEELRGKISLNGRKTILENFSLDKLIEKEKEIYKNL